MFSVSNFARLQVVLDTASVSTWEQSYLTQIYGVSHSHSASTTAATQSLSNIQSSKTSFDTTSISSYTHQQSAERSDSAQSTSALSYSNLFSKKGSDQVKVKQSNTSNLLQSHAPPFASSSLTSSVNMLTSAAGNNSSSMLSGSTVNPDHAAAVMAHAAATVNSVQDDPYGVNHQFQKGKMVVLEVPDVDPSEFQQQSLSSSLSAFSSTKKASNQPPAVHAPHVVLLSGKVVLSLSRPLTNCDELILSVQGKLDVDVTNVMHWLAPDVPNITPVSKALLERDAVLWSRATSNQRDLPAGDHEWTFALPLRSNLPPTVELNHGRIQYFVKAKITRRGISSTVYSPIVPLQVVRARPRGGLYTEHVLKDENGLFRVKANAPSAAFVGDPSFKMDLEISPLHKDVVGCLRAVKVFVLEKRSYSCGIAGRSTMFKDEAMLGKGAKYLVDTSNQEAYGENLLIARQDRHAEINFPLAMPGPALPSPTKLTVHVPLDESNPSFKTAELRVAHRIFIRLDMDEEIYGGPKIVLELPVVIVTPSKRRPVSWREGLPLRLPFPPPRPTKTNDVTTTNISTRSRSHTLQNLHQGKDTGLLKNDDGEWDPPAAQAHAEGPKSVAQASLNDYAAQIREAKPTDELHVGSEAAVEYTQPSRAISQNQQTNATQSDKWVVPVPITSSSLKQTDKGPAIFSWKLPSQLSESVTSDASGAGLEERKREVSKLAQTLDPTLRADSTFDGHKNHPPNSHWDGPTTSSYIDSFPITTSTVQPVPIPARRPGPLPVLTVSGDSIQRSESALGRLEKFEFTQSAEEGSVSVNSSATTPPAFSSSSNRAGRAAMVFSKAVKGVSSSKSSSANAPSGLSIQAQGRSGSGGRRPSVTLSPRLGNSNEHYLALGPSSPSSDSVKTVPLPTDHSRSTPATPTHVTVSNSTSAASAAANLFSKFMGRAGNTGGLGSRSTSTTQSPSPSAHSPVPSIPIANTRSSPGLYASRSAASTPSNPSLDYHRPEPIPAPVTTRWRKTSDATNGVRSESNQGSSRSRKGSAVSVGSGLSSVAPSSVNVAAGSQSGGWGEVGDEWSAVVAAYGKAAGDVPPVPAMSDVYALAAAERREKERMRELERERERERRREMEDEEEGWALVDGVYEFV